MQRITSRDNAKLKLARKVRDGRDNDLIFAEGVRLAREILRSHANVALCLVSDASRNSPAIGEIITELTARGTDCAAIPDNLFDGIADTANSQGIVLLCARPATNFAAFASGYTGGITVLLTEINNPSNLGAILRTAEAFEVSDVIVTANSADVFSPKSIRASMGSALRLNFWCDTDFDAAIEWATDQRLRVRAADISGGKEPSDLDWKIPSLIVFGSEAHGLNAKQLAQCNELFSIRMANDVESLNLGVAAGIVLYEAARGRS